MRAFYGLPLALKKHAFQMANLSKMPGAESPRMLMQENSSAPGRGETKGRKEESMTMGAHKEQVLDGRTVQAAHVGQPDLEF